MGKFVFVLCAVTALRAQTCTITSPALSSTQSKTIALHGTCSGVSAWSYAEWILNDNTRIARVQKHSSPQVSQSEPLSVYWNTARDAMDGPQWLKLVAYDAVGNVLTASPEINFTVNNYGLAVTVSSPTPTLPFPTVSGSITVRFSVTTALPRCNIGAAGIDGRTYKAGQYDPASGATLDTTTVTNGVHYFWAFAQYCDPVGGSAETGYSEVDRTAGVSFAANVQNGHTPMAVNPGVQNLTLTPGQTYTLAPFLQYTDGSTGSGTFTYAIDHACVPGDPTRTDMLFPCTSGTTYPLNNARGATYATLSTTGPASSTVITAQPGMVGESYITVTDTTSGKTTKIPMQVRQYQSVTHFGRDGSILHSYDPAKSIFRTSIEDFDQGILTGQEPQLAPHIVRSGYTAFETGMALDPRGYSSYAQWQSAWNSQYYTPILQAQALLGGNLSIIGRADGYINTNIMDSLYHGAVRTTFGSSIGVNDPVRYSFQQLHNTGWFAGAEMGDEVGSLSYRIFVPDYRQNMADGSINRIVCASNACTVYGGPGALWPGGARYSLNGDMNPSGNQIIVRNATSSQFNPGSTYTATIKYLFCSPINVWFHNQCPTHDTTNAPNYDTWTFNAPGITGTFNLASDPNLVIETSANLDSVDSGYFHNDNFTSIVASVGSNGPIAWPVIAMDDIYSHIFWRNAGFGQYQSVFKQESDCAGSMYVGPNVKGFFGSGACEFNHAWGPWDAGWAAANGPAYYWERDMSYGWTLHGMGPDVPNIFLVNGSGDDWRAGGGSAASLGGLNQRTISSMSGAVMTTTSAHGLPLPKPCPGCFATVKIAGNSDGAMNAKWNVGFSASNTAVELWKGGGSCTATVGGTLTIRGVGYTITNNSGGITVSTALPSDLTPGEHASATGCSGSFPVSSWSYLNRTVFLGSFANSAGNGGTATIDGAEEGSQWPVAPYDYVMTTNRMGRATVETWAAIADGWAGVRVYPFEGVFPIWIPSPGDGAQMQEGPMPYATAARDKQRRWRSTAQGVMLAKRLASLTLQAKIASPSPVAYSYTSGSATITPWMTTGAYRSPDGTTTVIYVNTSDGPQSATVNHPTYQIGSNPVSVYRIAYPEFYTQYLSGQLTAGQYTWEPGEVMVFVYHASAASYVVNTPISFDLSSVPNSASVVIRQTYVYPETLGEAGAASGVRCTVSPCRIPVDKGLGNVYIQSVYLDASGVELASGDPVKLN